MESNAASQEPERDDPVREDQSVRSIPKTSLARWGRLCLKELRETLRDRRTIITLILMPLLVYPLLSLIFNNFVLSSADSLGQLNCIIAAESDEQMYRLQQLLATGEAFLQERGEISAASANALNEDAQQPLPSAARNRTSDTDAVTADSNSGLPATPPRWLTGVAEPRMLYRIGQRLREEVTEGNIDVAVLFIAAPAQTQTSGSQTNSPSSGNADRSSTRRRAAESGTTEPAASENSPGSGIPYRLQLIYRRESALSEAGVRFLQRRLQVFNEEFLLAQLRQQGIPATRPIVLSEEAIASQSSRFSLTTIIPLILILMTITGAVYPAIDLTAGERERGTMEMLMAAPVPRLALLSAKYVAVLVVALLTATANLVAMTLTLLVTGLGMQIFGESGPPLVLISAVFALLILFAAFFSAILLALTSFARSFKEAQAYLIPVMLLSLAPGLMTLLPSLEFHIGLAVIPLVNIVLLARDLLEGTADPTLALAAVVCTGLYAVAALAIAARVFGTDAILYGAEVGWSELWARPEQLRTKPPLTGTFLCLAVLFPLYFLLSNLLQRSFDGSMESRLATSALVTALLFVGLPLVALRLQHVIVSRGFQLRSISFLYYLPAILLGLSLWPFAHELVLFSQALGLFTLSSSKLEAVQKLLEQWQNLSPLWIVFCLAVTPAVCEELFFRGYLLGALLGKTRPHTAILISALLFGLFHVVTTSVLAVERFLPSTFLGLFLGWVCYRTASVWPGMLLHATHNGFLLLVAYYRDALLERGWGIAEQSHLPFSWLLGATILAMGACGGLIGISRQSSTRSATSVES